MRTSIKTIHQKFISSKIKLRFNRQRDYIISKRQSNLQQKKSVLNFTIISEQYKKYTSFYFQFFFCLHFPKKFHTGWHWPHRQSVGVRGAVGSRTFSFCRLPPSHRVCAKIKLSIGFLASTLFFLAPFQPPTWS